jgi:LysM repeat protein
MMKPMQNEFKEDAPALREEADSQETTSLRKPSQRQTAGWMERLAQMGLGEEMLRMGANLFSVLSIAAAVFLAQAYYRQNSRASTVNVNPSSNPAAAAESQSIPAPFENPVMQGIARAAQPHTNVPSRPRQDIMTYIVQEGDTVFGIAEKFGLEPQTILWGNYNTLLDDPHSLRPGQTLNILPVDGVYWEWLGGIPFGEWAEFYGVTAAEIIEFPGNKLDPNSVGDYNNANIKAGTWLIIPGGKREFVNWSAPLGVTR